MGLYNVAIGDGHEAERGAILLAILGNPNVARYRDSWVERDSDGEPVIAVHTRTGGGNRVCYCADHGRTHPDPECYLAGNEALAAHPLYLRDADLETDPTYATFWFSVPPEYRDALARIAVDPVDMDARWQAAFDRIRNGELRPAETALADQIGAFLSDPNPDPGPRIMEV